MFDPLAINIYDLVPHQYNGAVIYVPRQYKRMPSRMKQEICNGCGPAGWKYDLVPDTVWGCKITGVCNPHDFMYHYGTTLADKWFSDAVFMMNGCLVIIHTSTSKFKIAARTMRMVKYYLAVALAGEDAFLKGKKGIKKNVPTSKELAKKVAQRLSQREANDRGE